MPSESRALYSNIYLPLDLSITGALCIYLNPKALILPVRWLTCDRSLLKDFDDSHRIWGGILYVIIRRPGMVTSQLGTVIHGWEDYQQSAYALSSKFQIRDC